MKRYGIAVCCLAVIIGCGSPVKKSSSQQAASQDFVAEGIAFLKANDVANAIHSFDKAIKADPTNPHNYFTLGQVYLRLQSYPRAIDTFSAATRIAPTSPQAYYLLAMSYGLEGKREEAVRAAQKSVELFMQQRDKEGFVRATALLRSLTGAQDKT